MDLQNPHRTAPHENGTYFGVDVAEGSICSLRVTQDRPWKSPPDGRGSGRADPPHNAAVPDGCAARYAGPAAALAAGTSRPITSLTATVSSHIQNTP